MTDDEYVKKELEEIKQNIKVLEGTIDAILESSRNNANGLNVLKDLVAQDHETLKKHERILITGNGEPSLIENFRTFNRVLTDFISEVKSERKKREDKEEEDRKEKREEKRRWKWAFIGLGFTLIPAFIYQFLIFWFSVVPKLSQLP